MSDDKISALNSIKVDAWGTGDRNDCYWNIAANQLGEGASAQEINALCQELQKYNQEKNTAIQKQGDMLNAGDQVFIPLEYAMDEIQTNVSNKQEEITTAQGELETAQGELSGASGEVNSTLSAYTTAMAAYQNASEDADNKDSLKTAMDDAKQAYLNAVQKQEEAQAKVEEKQQEIETKKGELEQYKTELSELKEEYAEEQEEYETELAQLDEQIASIDTSIQETETSLEQAKAEQQAAASQQEDAKNLGVTKDDEGNYTLDDSNLTPEQLEAAETNSKNVMTAKEYAGKEVEEESESDDGNTKTVKYADGTSAEFYKDPETGEWSALPSVLYDEDGNASSMEKVDAEDVKNGTAKTATDAEEALRSDMAEARAQQLFAAMDGWGTNEDAVRDILKNVAGQDLVDVMTAYEEKYGESLEDAIKGDFSFISGESELLGYLNSAKNYADVAGREEITAESVAEAQAKAFEEATSARLGTDEKVVYNMLNNGMLSDEAIINLANTLTAQGKDIVQMIKDDFSGDVEKTLLNKLEELGIYKDE